MEAHVTDTAIFSTCRLELLISSRVSDAVPIRVHDVVTPGKYELPAKHSCVISETATAVADRSDGAEDKIKKLQNSKEDFFLYSSQNYSSRSTV
jgi:hypothetical protein